MAERDINQEIVRNVEKSTEPEPVNREELLESEDPKRQLAEIKKQIPIRPRLNPRKRA